MAGTKARAPKRGSTRTPEAAQATDPKLAQRERIAEHIADFKRGGGRIEVLGNTRVLQKIDGAGPVPPTDAPPKPKRGR